MAHRGDLLDLVEARARVDRDLVAQEVKITNLSKTIDTARRVRDELKASRRVIEDELLETARLVFPSEGVVVEEDPPLPPMSAVRESMAETPDWGKDE